MFERSKPVQALVSLFTSAKRGSFYSYQELSEAAGVDVREKPSVIASARRICENESGVLVTCKRGMGYQVSTGSGAAQEVRTSVRKIHSASHKCKRKTTIAATRYVQDMSPMEAEEVRHVNRMLGAIQASIELNKAERKAIQAHPQRRMKDSA